MGQAGIRRPFKSKGLVLAGSTGARTPASTSDLTGKQPGEIDLPPVHEDVRVGVGREWPIRAGPPRHWIDPFGLVTLLAAWLML
jgi:hypothetical protein